MRRTRVYCARGGYTTRIRATAGVVAGDSMWNTITNVLRGMCFVWVCLGTRDGEVLTTRDGEVLIVRG